MREPDWPGVKARILHPYIPTAVLLYLPWALIQQILFQFYLLGRVRTFCPSLHPLAPSALNGLIFGLVHATDIRIVLLAMLGGDPLELVVSPVPLALAPGCFACADRHNVLLLGIRLRSGEPMEGLPQTAC